MRQLNRKEKGTALVFVSLLLVTLIILLSLAVDTSRWFIESLQQKSTADAAALAALDVYIDTSGSPEDKYNAAIARAAQIGGNNFSTVGGGRRFIDSEPSLRAGTDGSFVVGKWWLEKPATCNVSGCPCGSTGSDAAPCFQQCPAAGCPATYPGDRPEATAIRVGLKTPDTGLIKNIFGGAFNSSSQKVSTMSGSGGGDYATASLAPRYTMLLLDLGRRMSQESDLPYEQVYGTSPGEHYAPASEYGFYVFANASYPCAYSWQGIISPNEGGLCIASPAANATEYGNRSPEVFSDPAFPKLNYRLRSATHPVFGYTLSYLVDTTRDPQPFGTMLDAVNGALQAFVEDGNHMDKIGLLRYPALAMFGEQFPPVNVTDPSITTMLRLTQTYTTASFTNVQARELRFERLFFPNNLSDISNVVQATQRAAEILLPLPHFESANNSVTIFSQGAHQGSQNTCLPNKFPITDTVTGGIYPGRQNIFYSGGINTHNINYTEQVDSLNSFINTCAKGFNDSLPIKLNVALVGNNVVPHTVLIQSLDDPSRCMDDDEMRRRNYLDVIRDDVATNRNNYLNIGRSFNSANYTEPNYYFYAAARLTRGAWMPIRPTCDSAYTTSLINGVCEAGVTPIESLSDPDSTVNYVTKDPSLPSDVQDSAGRLVCDPEQRTPVQQGMDQFGSAFKRRQLILVE